MKKILIVGAGLSGATCAAQFAAAGFKVSVVEERPYVAGNAYDHFDENGVLIHKYGPHIFHTNSDRVFEFLSKFTGWRRYEHEVLARVGGVYYPVPLNINSCEKFFGFNILDESEFLSFLDKKRIPCLKISSAQDFLYSSIGEELAENFFSGYSQKQWGVSLRELDPSVVARVPVRYSRDNRYFLDKYQGAPSAGFTCMVSRMLDHPLINVELNCGATVADFSGFDSVIYTGPVDRLLDYRFGKLPYRSLRFEFEHHPGADFVQPKATINYPSLHDGAHTRITEFKQITGQLVSGSTTVKEFPCENGDPYYPVPSTSNKILHEKYVESLRSTHPSVLLVGRLAEYKYYNMDQAVGSALALVKRVLNSE